MNFNGLKAELVGSCLATYGAVKQFFELRLESEKYEDIILNMDCEVTTNCDEINKIVEQFKFYDAHAYMLAYFIPFNLRAITDLKYEQKENKFEVLFDNNKSLIFNFIECDHDLDISFFNNKRELVNRFSFEHV